jgi:hypothetical protein
VSEPKSEPPLWARGVGYFLLGCVVVAICSVAAVGSVIVVRWALRMIGLIA